MPMSSEKSDIKRWREDSYCGENYPLPDGNVTECDPDGNTRCCGDYIFCGNRDFQCYCTTCTDYRIVKKIQNSGKSCVVTPIGGFLKNVCVDKTKSRNHFKKSLYNHRTSISLEPEFWDALEIKAKEQNISLSKLVLEIDNEKPKDYNNLASYIRIWVLKKIG